MREAEHEKFAMRGDNSMATVLVFAPERTKSKNDQMIPAVHQVLIPP